MVADSIQNCPTNEIAAYIDGELPSTRELELDLHFAACRSCNSELNSQKQFLRGLDLSLRHEPEVKLPENFAKLVATNAESSVSGLRRPRERFNALFLCAALSLFALFVLGSQAEDLFDQVGVVGGFFGHIVYSFFVGIAIIVRNVASQSEFGPSVIILLTVIFASFSLYVSRRVINARGA